MTFTILAKEYNNTDWTSTDALRLDHALPVMSSDSFDGKRVGDLVAVDYDTIQNKNSDQAISSLHLFLDCLMIDGNFGFWKHFE